MQTFTTMILLAISSLAAADDVAIRMLLNGGREVNNAGSCARPERDLIRISLLSSGSTVEATQRRRSLRVSGGGTKLNSLRCSDICAGFAPGTCWPIAAGCAKFQRFDTDDVLEEVTLLSDRELTIPELSNIHVSDFTEDEYASCQQKRQAVLREIQGLLSGEDLSTTCKQVLQMKIDLACVKVPGL